MSKPIEKMSLTELRQYMFEQSITPQVCQGCGSRELQALLVWLGNYGHLSYGKQQELLSSLELMFI